MGLLHQLIELPLVTLLQTDIHVISTSRFISNRFSYPKFSFILLQTDSHFTSTSFFPLRLMFMFSVPVVPVLFYLRLIFMSSVPAVTVLSWTDFQVLSYNTVYLRLVSLRSVPDDLTQTDFYVISMNLVLPQTVCWCSEPSQLQGITSRLTPQTAFHVVNTNFGYLRLVKSTVPNLLYLRLNSCHQYQLFTSGLLSPQCQICFTSDWIHVISTKCLPQAVKSMVPHTLYLRLNSCHQYQLFTSGC